MKGGPESDSSNPIITRPNRWLHTDLMNLSHFHTHLLFESLVTKGVLK